MEYRKVGNSGLKVSVISLSKRLTYGSDVVQQETAMQYIHRAIEGDANFIDVADMYSYGHSEESAGKVAEDDRFSSVLKLVHFLN